MAQYDNWSLDCTAQRGEGFFLSPDKLTAILSKTFCIDKTPSKVFIFPSSKTCFPNAISLHLAVHGCVKETIVVVGSLAVVRFVTCASSIHGNSFDPRYRNNEHGYMHHTNADVVQPA